MIESSVVISLADIREAADHRRLARDAMAKAVEFHTQADKSDLDETGAQVTSTLRGLAFSFERLSAHHTGIAEKISQRAVV